MPRRKVNRSTPGPYHVSSRCINKEWFQIPMDKVWDIFCRHLYFTKFGFNLKIHAFVLMNNHYHLLLSTPDLNLSAAMKYFLRNVSWELNHEGNRINRTFAGRYYPTYLECPHYFLNTYKYIYQNPVRAGIVDRAEEYQYSSLSGLLGHKNHFLPVENDTILFNGSVEENLKWINYQPKEEDLRSMRRALRRGIFTLPKDQTKKTTNRLETELL